MNILLVPSSYVPNAGGVEVMTHALAQQLHRAGHGVSVATARWPGTLPESSLIDGVEVIRYNFAMPSRNPARLFSFIRDYWNTTRSLLALHGSRAFDVIHIHCLGPNAFYATWLARRIRRPLVITSHGEFQGDDTGAKVSLLMRFIRRWAFNQAAWVTACSHFTLEHIPIPIGSRSSVVYNAIPDDWAEAASSSEHTPPLMLCVARLSHSKGIDIALKAFSLAASRLDDAQLWIAGDGDDRIALEELAKSLGVGQQVRFLGAVPPARVRDLIQTCRFVVCPSRNEGFGLVILEAMALGKPVIAFRVGGIPEVVTHRQTGLLIPGLDPRAMAEAMVQLMDDSHIRSQLGTVARTRAAQFSWSQTVAQYLEIYRLVGDFAEAKGGCDVR